MQSIHVAALTNDGGNEIAENEVTPKNGMCAMLRPGGQMAQDGRRVFGFDQALDTSPGSAVLCGV